MREKTRITMKIWNHSIEQKTTLFLLWKKIKPATDFERKKSVLLLTIEQRTFFFQVLKPYIFERTWTTTRTLWGERETWGGGKIKRDCFGKKIVFFSEKNINRNSFKIRKFTAWHLPRYHKLILTLFSIHFFLQRGIDSKHHWSRILDASKNQFLNENVGQNYKDEIRTSCICFNSSFIRFE